MNHNNDDIRNRLNAYRSGDPTKKTDADKQDGDISYFEPNENGVRNVCFVLLDGKHIFLNYNYLVSGEFFPEENRIALHFTTHGVTLKGYNLEKLYQDLVLHSPKMIVATNDRYSGIVNESISIVTAIEIK